MPGLGVQLPLIHITRVRDIHEHTMDIEPQPVITKDNVEITVDGVMWVRPAGNEESISPTLLLGSLPVNVSTGNGKGVKLVTKE